MFPKILVIVIPKIIISSSLNDGFGYIDNFVVNSIINMFSKIC